MKDTATSKCDESHERHIMTASMEFSDERTYRLKRGRVELSEAIYHGWVVQRTRTWSSSKFSPRERYTVIGYDGRTFDVPAVLRREYPNLEAMQEAIDRYRVWQGW